MANKKGYAVIRFVTSNGRCHKGSDFIKGQLLADYFKMCPQVGKAQLVQWMRQLLKQLEQYHKCSRGSYYRYVNPYMFVLTAESKIVLLDLQEESNRELVRQMQREAIRAKFLPPEEPHYKRGSMALDIYGLGKTMQFILAHTDIQPVLSKFEEYTYQKIIKKCLNLKSEKRYSSVTPILKKFPKLTVRETPRLRIVLSILAVLIGIFIIFSDSTESTAEAISHTAADREGEKEVIAADTVLPEENNAEQQLYLELGRIYLGELEMPEKSQIYFTKISSEDELAAGYEKIAGCFARQSALGEEQELEMALLKVEALLEEENLELDYCILLKGYALLKTAESNQNIIRIGEKGLENIVSTEKKIEVIGQIAAAYAEIGKIEKALEKYRELKELTEDTEELTEIYIKMIQVLEEADNIQQAVSLCTEGVEELPYVMELKIQHIRLLCLDKTEAGQEIIQKYIQEWPVITGISEFQELQLEVPEEG